MTHLGDKASALVDGQLPIEAAERALAHLAQCRACREWVEAERLLKARLSCLPGPEPEPDLAVRLLALGGPAGPLPPRPGHVPGSPRPKPVPRGPTHPPAHPQTAHPQTAHPQTAHPQATHAQAGRSHSSRFETGGLGAARQHVSRPPGRSGSPGPRAGSVRRRVLVAGAVLGALGVVSAGVGGLILAAPSGPPRTPSQAPLDSFVVHRPLETPAAAPDGSLQLRQRPSAETVDAAVRGGR